MLQFLLLANNDKCLKSDNAILEFNHLQPMDLLKQSAVNLNLCRSECSDMWFGVKLQIDNKNMTRKVHLFYFSTAGWLGWAMVLGSFQCRGVLLLLHIVGQGPAVLAADAGRVGYIFYIFHLSSISNVLSFGRRLNMTEILWFRLLNPNGSCQLLPRTSSLSTG